SFVSPPDYEHPQGGDGNHYILLVQATDNRGASDQIYLSIDVKDVYDPPPNTAPTITSPNNGNQLTIDFAENNTAAVTTVHATDAEGGAITYSLVTNDPSAADSAKFTIGASSGVLSFKSPPDFENPQAVSPGSNGNTYVVMVRATDNLGATDVQKISVRV